MGTPAFAVPALRALAEDSPHEVLFVVTQPDKPQGRGMHVQPPPEGPGPELRAKGLSAPGPEVERRAEGSLRLFGLDAVAVVAYGRMIPADWLDIPRFGFINVHASLLPEFRGAAPINRAILAGRHLTGISIMRIEEAMDAGPVYLQASTPIGDDEDAVSLSTRLSELGAAKLVEVLPLIEAGTLKAEPQDHSRATYAPSSGRRRVRSTGTGRAGRSAPWSGAGAMALRLHPHEREDPEDNQATWEETGCAEVPGRSFGRKRACALPAKTDSWYRWSSRWRAGASRRARPFHAG